MSNRAVTWAYKQTALKAGRKFVLVTLADLADSEHSCFPGITLLAEMTGIAESTVREHLTELAADGYLAKERRHRKDGTRTSNRYYLDVDGALEVQPPESGDGEDEGLPPESGEPTARKPEDLPPDSGGHIEESLNPQGNPQVNPQSPQTPTLDIDIEDDVPPAPTDDELFDRFWAVWPRKEAKKTARKSFDRALTLVEKQIRAEVRAGTRLPSTVPLREVAAAVITDAATWWASWWLTVEHRPLDRIPHPSTWLNGDRWTDHRPEPQQLAERRPPTRTEQNLAVVARYAAMEAEEAARNLLEIES